VIGCRERTNFLSAAGCLGRGWRHSLIGSDFEQGQAVELVNRSLIGQTFHRYVRPQRAMPADRVRGAWLVGEVLG
jgi:hypothetical protein